MLHKSDVCSRHQILNPSQISAKENNKSTHIHSWYFISTSNIYTTFSQAIRLAAKAAMMKAE